MKELFIKRFINTRKGDRVGLVYFAGESYLQVPLTTDYLMFDKLLSRIEAGKLSPDGTAIGNGIALAVLRMKDQKTHSKVIILLTDGNNNAGNISPKKAAELAKKHGIKIYTILIGTNRPARIKVGTDFFGEPIYKRILFPTDPELLKHIAKVTGGKFYKASSPGALKEAFKNIDMLEKSPIPSKSYRIYDEYAFNWLLLALIFILLGRLFSIFFPVYPEVER